MRTALLEPLDTATVPDVHIDLHVPADCVIKHHLYSAQEACLTIGPVKLHLNAIVLQRLMEHGALAKDDLDLIARYPDPLPEI